LFCEPSDEILPIIYAEKMSQDWREQLYYWRGSLKVHKGHVAWEGTWCGTFGSEPPSDEDYATNSTQTFGARGPKRTDALPPPVRAKWKSVYAMDNDGSGKVSKYSDSRHSIAFRGVSTTTLGERWACVARGRNEFGRFCSWGECDGKGVLTLARRYLRDDDPRAKMSLEELMDAHVADSFSNQAGHCNASPKRSTTQTTKSLKHERNADTDTADEGSQACKRRRTKDSPNGDLR
jgi:hypothetical protein